jgi:hypothetical protein
MRPHTRKSAKSRHSKSTRKSKSKHPKKAIADRDLLHELRDSFHRIGQSLAEIDEFRDAEIDRQEAKLEAETREIGNAGPPIDLLSSVKAVSAIQEHLKKRGIESDTLERLKHALISVFYGKPLAMFSGPALRHRPPDTPKILEIKGMLAAAMHEYQKRDKLSRVNAARAVLKNISPDLKIHLSKTDLTIRMIQDWRDMFGSVRAKPSTGKDAYTNFKKAFSSNLESHDKYIQLLTAQYARILPNL